MPDTLTWTSGHAATAPPSAAINALRQMVTGMYPSPCEGCLVKGTIPRREHVVFTFGEGRMPMLPAMSGAASPPAAPIYFPTIFRSASLILSCQPGPAS